MKNIYIITNIASHYRSSLWEKLLNNRKYNFNFFFGKDLVFGIKEINFNDKNIKFRQSQIHKLTNVYFKDKIIIWQKGIIKKCLTSQVDTAIILGDSWIISNWIIAIILRLKGVKVIFWSHGIYGNEPKIKKWIRILFYKLAHEHLLYERRGKRQMVINGFKECKLHVIFNSLNYEANLMYRKAAEKFSKTEIYPFFPTPELPTIIFIGRLTEVKKLNYLIEAVNQLNIQKYLVNLLIIGEGGQRKKLIGLAKEYGIDNQCHFYGPCYSEKILSSLISTADLCVSPGNVGLTGIHSMSYGTPVLTHNNFINQMPEVEAIIEGKNGCFFSENDISSMVSQLINWLFYNKLTRDEIRSNCYNIIDNYYNPNYQVKVIENIIEDKQPFL
ncbi:glycosyltransferase [Arenibacter latericius]|uniref:glycosyltransferase n=1 Tax=Arenibacter latericius TaxID=86104 RepID=UPI0003FAB28D|nr:glycosyltransferase [Arenibacter latericius]